MLIREARPDDWPRIWPFWHRIVAAGETYTWDPGTSEEDARALWMSPAKRVYVVEDDGTVVASAYLTPNYGGPAADIANAGFMVDPDRAGRGPDGCWPSTCWPRRATPGTGAWCSTPSSRPTPP